MAVRQNVKKIYRKDWQILPIGEFFFSQCTRLWLTVREEVKCRPCNVTCTVTSFSVSELRHRSVIFFENQPQKKKETKFTPELRKWQNNIEGKKEKEREKNVCSPLRRTASNNIRPIKIFSWIREGEERERERGTERNSGKEIWQKREKKERERWVSDRVRVRERESKKEMGRKREKEKEIEPHANEEASLQHLNCVICLFCLPPPWWCMHEEMGAEKRILCLVLTLMQWES